MGFFDRRTEGEQIPETTTVEQELKRSKFFGWRDVVVCLLIVGVFMLIRDTEFGKNLGKNVLGLGGYDGLDPVLEEKQLGITGLDGGTHTFVYAEWELELRDNLKEYLASEKGELVAGEETKRVCSGTYRNDAFGEYQLHVQIKLSNYIVVHDKNGVLVFNLESNDTTKELYNYIMELRQAQLTPQS